MARIDGIVTEASNRRPLSGVRIVLRDALPVSLTGYEATTDDSGRFSVQAPSGRYRLRTELLGYELAEIIVVAPLAGTRGTPLSGVGTGRITTGSIDVVAGQRYEIRIELSDSIAGPRF